jgi:hypothetical protein
VRASSILKTLDLNVRNDSGDKLIVVDHPTKHNFQGSPETKFSRTRGSGLTPRLHRYASALGALIDETGIADTVEALVSEDTPASVIAEVNAAG